jgi:hypothetical protein
MAGEVGMNKHTRGEGIKRASGHLQASKASRMIMSTLGQGRLRRRKHLQDSLHLRDSHPQSILITLITQMVQPTSHNGQNLARANVAMEVLVAGVLTARVRVMHLGMHHERMLVGVAAAMEVVAVDVVARVAVDRNPPEMFGKASIALSV